MNTTGKHICSSLGWTFTAEAADNTLPAGAAAGPAERGQPWGRKQAAC